jgi:hypothetical protein
MLGGLVTENRSDTMRLHHLWAAFFTSLALGATWGGPSALAAQEGETWIEYAVTGDFAAEGKDLEAVLCSSDAEEDQFNLAARGIWYIDLEFYGSADGEYEATFTVAVPADVEGASSNVFERRMEGDGMVTMKAAGTGPMGMPLVEGSFTATDLTGRGGQSISISGTFRCAVM